MEGYAMMLVSLILFGLACAVVFLGCATPARAARIDPATRTIYADPDTVDAECRARLGWFTAQGPVRAYRACYDAGDDVVILPHDPPRWLREHEDAHRNGWSHDRQATRPALQQPWPSCPALQRPWPPCHERGLSGAGRGGANVNGGR